MLIWNNCLWWLVGKGGRWLDRKGRKGGKGRKGRKGRRGRVGAGATRVLNEKVHVG